MGRVNIPLTIHRPGVEKLTKVSWVANAAAQTNVIPFRYPFADISNYTALKTDGFFRHTTTDVSTNLGGSKTTNTASNLGYELPRTEKLILLVKVNEALTTDKNITIKIEGSTEYNIVDKTYVLAEDGSVDTTADAVVEAGDIFEIDLYNFGLYIDGGEVTISADGNAATDADDDKVSFALISRAG